MQNINKVLYNHDQSSEFTSEQKAVARNNIGAQAQLTAGTGINISGNEISCTVSPGPTYNVFSTSADGLVPKANNTGDTGKFLRGDHTWQYPLTGTDGDTLRPNYITQDAGGQLHYLRCPRLFWEFTFREPSVELTADDITNGYVEFRFSLGSEGAEIAENGNIVAMKGYDIETGNILNGKQMSFYLVGHGSTSPRILIDYGFETFTEAVVNGYSWKAFNSIGLSMNRNTAKLDAVLRVPLSSGAAGDTVEIPGYITVSVFGISQNDA